LKSSQTGTRPSHAKPCFANSTFSPYHSMEPVENIIWSHGPVDNAPSSSQERLHCGLQTGTSADSRLSRGRACCICFAVCPSFAQVLRYQVESKHHKLMSRSWMFDGTIGKSARMIECSGWQTGERMGGRGARTGGQADKWTGRWTGGRADVRLGGRTDGQVDGQTFGRTGGRRTSGRLWLWLWRWLRLRLRLRLFTRPLQTFLLIKDLLPYDRATVLDQIHISTLMFIVYFLRVSF
jgi:hypothetical protein